MPHKLNIILNALPSLNKVELEEVIKKASFLEKTKGVRSSGSEEETFYGILTSELVKMFRNKPTAYFVFVKQCNYNSFKTDFEGTLDYMEIAFKNKRITRPAKLHFYLIATKIIINDFDTSPVPLNLKTLINGFNILPSLIDREFPGYAQAGLLPMILKAKYKNKPPRGEEKEK